MHTSNRPSFAEDTTRTFWLTFFFDMVYSSTVNKREQYVIYMTTNTLVAIFQQLVDMLDCLEMVAHEQTKLISEA